MRLFNTLKGTVEEFRTPEEGKIKMYVCGVTVYDHSHVGHARTIIFFDVLRRYLLHKGYSVTYVQNFTDVDDKIINRAREKKITPLELAQIFIDQYEKDFQALNVLRPDYSPKATENIKEMIDIVQRLIEKGYGYKTPNGVYFRVGRFEEYGRLSKKPIDDLLAGARVEVDPHKENPLDFALWKFSGDDLSWDSPWGKGRPGWHIECSAMAAKYLGETVDIHGGGKDLIFPHHENEIAQSEAANLKPFSRYWVHVGLLSLEKEKMSKSLGNIVTVEEALRIWGPNSLRLYSVSIHYSKPLEYSERGLQNAVNNWKLIENAAWELKSTSSSGGIHPGAREILKGFQDDFYRYMESDIDTVGATQVLMKLVRYVNRLAAESNLSRETAQLITPIFDGLLFVFGLKLPEVGTDAATEVEMLIAERKRLRSEKNFEAADAIREELRKRGFELIDHPN